MPPKAWNAKRERQYEHIKDSLEDRGTSEDKAEEIAARTVNKERARAGEARTSSRLSRTDISSGRRGGTPLRHAPVEGADARPALRGGQEHGDRGPLEDDEGAAAARGRPAEVDPVAAAILGR